MPVRVNDRLTQARRRQFVGREREKELFKSAVDAQELPFQVLYLHGPGGVDKTTLLHEFAAICEQAHTPVFYVDTRNIEPTSQAFVSAIAVAAGQAPNTNLFQLLSSSPTRRVFMLDTFETLDPLDCWLREQFLPELPDNFLFVLASRNQPAQAWHADPGWQTFFHALALRNFAPSEGREYLEKRSVPADQYETVLEFAHGHPLALSLIADLLSQRPGLRFQPQVAPDMIRTLVEQFVQKVPSPAHRAALEACALVRVTTEGLLGQMLKQRQVEIQLSRAPLRIGDSVVSDTSAVESTHELFDWLRSLSFVESSPEGVFPHDLAREALVADLRWRNPDWNKELHNRARGYYVNAIQTTHGIEQQRILLDFVFLHRDNPVIRHNGSR